MEQAVLSEDKGKIEGGSIHHQDGLHYRHVTTVFHADDVYLP